MERCESNKQAPGRSTYHCPNTFTSIRNTVGFAGAWELFDATGHLRNPERHEKVAGGMLDQLAWWGQALKEGRSIRPDSFVLRCRSSWEALTVLRAFAPDQLNSLALLSFKLLRTAV
jgi:hypothetical protein